MWWRLARGGLTATFSGCSSALLFRDEDKALNPSVDLTFVPVSIFKLSWASRSCELAEARRIRCMFGQRWLQELLSVWLGNPTTSTAAGKPQPDLPDTQNHYGLFVVEGAKSEEKRNVYFCLRRTLKLGHPDTLQASLQSWLACLHWTSPFQLLSAACWLGSCYTASHIWTKCHQKHAALWKCFPNTPAVAATAHKRRFAAALTSLVWRKTPKIIPKTSKVSPNVQF